MLQAFRDHKRWLMFIAMVLIIPSFVVTGIYSYNRMTQADNSIAKVGDSSITPELFDQASASSSSAFASRWATSSVQACSTRLRPAKPSCAI